MSESDSLLGTLRKLSHGTFDGLMEEKPKLSYKSTHHMSHSAFETLAAAVMKQKAVTEQLTKSASVGGNNNLTDYVPALVNKEQRKALYETLPFVAAHGMQHRENKIRRVLSTASMRSFEDLCLEDGQVNEALTEIDVDEIIMTFPLVMATGVAVMAQFLVGYNTGVLNAPEAVVFAGHSTLEWSMAVSAFAIGGPLGSIVGGWLANAWGRRGAMFANIWSFLLGGLVMTTALNIYQLIFSRLIIGFASGVSSVVVPVYLGEIAPPTLRGTLGTCTQFALVIGILMSDVFAFPLATTERWRYLFAITPILAFVQLLLSSHMVESPRWLLSRDSESIQARVAIKQLRGYRFDRDVEAEIENFLVAAQKHKTDHSSAHSSSALWELLHCKEMSVLVVASVVLQTAQQFCGINAVFYYSTGFFQGIMSSPLLGTTVVAAVNVVATYVALQLMDSTARRTLLLWSCGGMLVSIVFIVLALLQLVNQWWALAAVMAFVSFFEIGLGPIPWLIVAEMFDAKWVATAMSLSCIVNWLCNFLVGLGFPFLQQWLGPFSFVPFGIMLIATFVYVYAFLPETYGRSVEEIHRIFGVKEEYAVEMPSRDIP